MRRYATTSHSQPQQLRLRIPIHVERALELCINTASTMLRLFTAVCALLAASLVSAVSTSGNRLLVVLDDVAEKGDYSTFFGDLAGESSLHARVYGQSAGRH